MTSLATGLVCVRCGKQYLIGRQLYGPCPSCYILGSTANLKVTYDYTRAAETISRATLDEDGGRRRRPLRSVWRFHELLPVEKKENMLELGDGGTPLIDARKIAKKIGVKRLYFKDESRNLTWSFKDRLACTGVGKALDFGVEVVTCLTTGNHGAAVAAHCSAAGLESVVFTVPYVPKTMLVLMRMCGAKLVPVQLPSGRFGHYPYSIMKRCVEEKGWYPLGTYVDPSANNPYGVDGYKTIGYEICEQLDWISPDYVSVPTGDGDGLTGTWRGMVEFERLGMIDAPLPRMMAVQPNNAAPLVDAISKGKEEVSAIPTKPTVQFSTGVGSGSVQAIRTIRESNGLALAVDDPEVLEMQRELGRLEGVFAEQSSVSSVAGVARLLREGKIPSDSTVVCILTSGGLKDVDSPGALLAELSPIPEDWDSFVRFMKSTYDLGV